MQAQESRKRSRHPQKLVERVCRRLESGLGIFDLSLKWKDQLMSRSVVARSTAQPIRSLKEVGICCHTKV